MKPKTIAILAAVTISGTFLCFVLSKPNLFNMLPFSIYQSFDKGGDYENTFITTFDIIISVVMLIGIYWFMYNLIIPLVSLEAREHKIKMKDDKIIKRIALIKGLGGMTVNERLWEAGLDKEFYRVIKTDKARARKILSWIKVDEPSIDNILKSEQPS